MGVEYSDIKIGSLKLTTPEAVGSNVQTCTILSIRRGSCKGFTSYQLQIRFNTNIIANFSWEVGSQIPDFIVSYGGEAALWAEEDMFNRELGTTG